MLHGLDQHTNSIYAPVQEGLVKVEEKLRSLAKAETSHVKPLLQYVTEAGGKRVRPAITLLAAQFHPHDPARPVLMASAVELLHLATLIHDDTVDNSPLRRGRSTVSNTWNSHVAVLFGDYVFATSATFVCDTQNIRVIRRFSETIMELASGQLMEYFTAFDPVQARNLYNDRIYRKTASLFCTASESGALLGEAPEEEVQALKDYGYNLGMAFQVGDDLLDFQGDPTDLGKPVGSDLMNGVLTLPTIMLLERYPNDDLVPSLFQDPTDQAKLQKVLEVINNSAILADCEQVVQDYCDKARQSLQILPDCAPKQSLLDLTDYVTARRR
ncbi:MAG TPA: heptaprenyl diphosphate synthase [Dehalococcoidia bacterium]|nr:heptaprenyl diphosphate synthase [Chloroflexota bacterium]MQF95760.1 polyprenyl synthetase family protein [SAR202 cluster bacterium]HCL26704.1 heptaprenyl diphosphate synthase [Dehalococcoidia bacterium]|tara:strand:- start:61 stop:1044 length:984 start_codon:yes stop_codon:yes gene_type:complete